MSNYETERYRKRRQEALNLLGGKCVKCGSRYDSHIHHIDPKTKSFTLASSWTKPWTIILEELEKCEILCAECHRKHHATSHGKRRMYRKGCRCQLCSEAQRVYMREYKRKQRKREKLIRSSTSLPS